MTKAIRPPTPGVRFTKGIVALLKGGTSSSSKSSAIASLQGLDSDFFDEPNHPASLDGVFNVRSSQLPVNDVSSVTLSGLKYLFIDQVAEILKANPELKATFEDKKASDPNFKNSEWEQLYFIYSNSPYFEQTFMRLPVYEKH